MPALVETQKLGKRYARVEALVDCDLEVRRQEILGLLGPNGSGKTTLLRLLMGFLRPTNGSARILGLDCYRQSVEVHRQVSYLPGEPRLFRGMTGWEIVSFFTRVRSQIDKPSVLALADRLGVDLGGRITQYSTGTRQKLALAVTLAAQTELVILDEPTSNLDPSVRADVIRLVGEVRSAGRTVIFSSHVLDEVEEACDRVVLLRQGRIVHVQVMAQLLRRHQIKARALGPLAPPPEALAIKIEAVNGQVLIHTPGELAPVLPWLAAQPLADVRIEPFGLKALYQRCHEVSGP